MSLAEDELALELKWLGQIADDTLSLRRKLERVRQSLSNTDILPQSVASLLRRREVALQERLTRYTDIVRERTTKHLNPKLKFCGRPTVEVR